jgi:HEAT repeat protein
VLGVHSEFDPAPLGRAASAAGLERRLVRDLTAAPPMRGLAALTLCRLRLPDAVRLVEPLTMDPDPDVSQAACRGLALLATDEAAAALIRVLVRGNVPASRTLECLGRPFAVRALLEALPDAEPKVRALLARALGLAGNREAEPPLLRLAYEGDDEERVAAVQALGRIGGRDSTLALVRALADGFGPVRAQAATALGELRSTAAIPALEGALADPDWWARSNAATALRALGEPGLAALHRALSHPDRFARDRAREALSLAGVELAEAA